VVWDNSLKIADAWPWLRDARKDFNEFDEKDIFEIFVWTLTTGRCFRTFFNGEASENMMVDFSIDQFWVFLKQAFNDFKDDGSTKCTSMSSKISSNLCVGSTDG
jgi:hypothetical protein